MKLHSNGISDVILFKGIAWFPDNDRSFGIEGISHIR